RSASCTRPPSLPTLVRSATLLDRTPSEHWEVVRFSLPDDLARYVVDKGSITVDGTSLTVVEAADDWFSVSLIPTTLADTVLGTRDRKSTRLNSSHVKISY